MTGANILLYGLLDPQIARGRSLADLARQAADGGVTLLQYRDKDATTRDMLRHAEMILRALEKTAVPLLINDRVDVALGAGAHGVHVGRDDMPPEKARALMGPEAIIGATVKNNADLDRLRDAPISYICIGGVFPTNHKNNPDAPVGLSGFSALRDRAKMLWPHRLVGAIAGITADNAGDVIRAGADGVAVIGALFGADDVAAQAHKMRTILDAAAAENNLARS
ncbi:MAG: thiamine phosphate synthase [Beijerinckiaceae bacterium]